jgi:hypothetical protein
VHCVTAQPRAALYSPCSKFLAKNIPLERLLTEFKQEQDDTQDSGSEDQADDEGLRNDAAAAPGSGSRDVAASPGYSHSEDGTDDVDRMKVNDTLGYCQVRAALKGRRACLTLGCGKG